MSKYANLKIDNVKEILLNTDDDYSKRKVGDLDLEHFKEITERYNFFNQELKIPSSHPDYDYTTLWYPSDTQELFEQNCENTETFKLLQQLKWSDSNKMPSKVTYNLNEQGFRCKSFNKITNPGILFLGCSQTFGVGLQNEHTFAQLVSDKFGYENINLGCPGKGLDYVSLYTTLLLKDLLNLKLIKAIVIFLPPPGRISYVRTSHSDDRLEFSSYHDDKLLASNFYNDNGIPYLNPIHKIIVEENDNKTDSWIGSLEKLRSNNYENFIIQKENNFIRDYFSYRSIELFAKELNVPLVVQNRNTTITNTLNLARDLMHMGDENHRNTAIQIVTKLKPFLDK